MVDMAVDLLDKVARRVNAVLLLAIVHHSQLHDARKVAARGNGDGQNGNGDPHDLGMRFVETEAVVKFFIVPALELNDQVDLRRGLYAAHAEELLNVHHADAAHLEVVADELGRGASGR